MPETATRRLILVRHAKSDYPAAVADHDRPLNARGTADAPQIGQWLKDNLDLPVDARTTVLVSSARRAQLTWSLAEAELGRNWATRTQRTEARIYEASVSTLLRIVDETPDDIGTLVIVGHNPGLLSVVARLGIVDAKFEEAVAKFPTSAIAVLETTEDWAVATSNENSWTVVGFAAPRG